MNSAENLPHRYCLLAVFALSLVAYAPTLRVGFLWDDHVMIETNPALREWSYETLKHDFTTDVFDGHGDAYFRPAQTILNRIDFTVWGLRPFGYHLTNWLGHTANAILLMELALVLGLGSLAALLAGCLMAVHPIPVEQLLIIAGRAEIFTLTFVLTSLLYLLRRRKVDWLKGYAAFLVALLFKESALITPALLACLYAYKHSPRSTYARLIPYGLIAIPYLLLRRAAVGNPFEHMDLSLLPLFFTKAFPNVMLIYVRLILFPWNLHSHRMMPHLTHAWPIFLGILVALPCFLYKRKAYLGLLGFAWFILCLLPKVPVMMHGNFMLDHFAYPAMIGVLLPLAAFFARLWEGRANSTRYMLGMCFFPLLIGWALLVHLNVALRGTDERMYRWALQFSESHPVKFNLGLLLLQTGRPEEAIPYLEDVCALYPENPSSLAALGRAYAQTGRKNKARKILAFLEKKVPK